MAIDRIRSRCANARHVVRHELVAEQVEIDPLRARPTFLAAQHGGIEVPRPGKVINWKGEVEWVNSSHQRSLKRCRIGHSCRGRNKRELHLHE
jgi:hypothetical protein